MIGGGGIAAGLNPKQLHIAPSASLDQLLRRLQVGIPASLLDLLELPVTLSRGACLALHRHGVTDRAKLAAMQETEAAAMIGDDLANALAKARCLAPAPTTVDHAAV